MRDYSKLKYLAKKNNGYIFSKDVASHNIPKDYLRYAVNDGVIEKVAHGIYILTEEFIDNLYVFQQLNSKIIYSAFTSAYLLDLTTRDSSQIYASVPKSYNPHKIKQNGLFIREDTEDYKLGIINIKTSFGNVVRCHDMHRTICDLFSPKYIGDKFVQIEALKNYVNSKDKDIAKLMSYANQLGVVKEIRDKLEVLL